MKASRPRSGLAVREVGMLSASELNELNCTLEQCPPEAVLCWALETFGADIAASSSFQTQSLPLLHMISRVQPQMPIIFLDTGYHFPETLAFRDQLVRQWNLNLQVIRPAPAAREARTQHREPLYRRDPDLCCYVNKVQPMQQAVQALAAWVSGIRRDQSPARASAQILERAHRGTVLVHPLLAWTRQDVWSYIEQHELPVHPLLDQGYLSVGCAPCTRPVRVEDNERAGRWLGLDKTECGLHTLLCEETEDLTLDVLEPVSRRR